jgi:RNA polymerase sigma-70 factor (sigma-E family)
MGATVTEIGTPLATFVAEHGRTLTRFAYLICGDRGVAEDLTQDAFTSLYRRYGDYLPLEAPVAYARKTIVNGHISTTRRKMASVTTLGLVPDRAVDSADPAERDAMWQALSGLGDRSRAVLVMRYYLDLHDREIAELLGCREGTVRSLATRAFAQLRDNPHLGPNTNPRAAGTTHPRQEQR